MARAGSAQVAEAGTRMCPPRRSEAEGASWSARPCWACHCLAWQPPEGGAAELNRPPRLVPVPADLPAATEVAMQRYNNIQLDGQPMQIELIAQGQPGGC